MDNFRPISILPSLSKILENAVHKQLYSYLNQNNLLSERQSGFRPLHSTTTCLTEITDYLLDNMNSGQITGTIFYDLRKAFDVILHKIILDKLFFYGMSNKVYEWFKSYLIGRQHCVSIDNHCSEYLTVKSGVPQGSILGPLIFFLYINDINNLTFHNNSKVSLYADDTVIFNNSNVFSEVQQNLQNDFDLICKWFDINEMYIHPQKTMVMSFGSKRKLENNRLSIKLNGKNLQCVETMKYLGVILDSQLTWSEHIKYISTKISRSTGCIRRIKRLIPPSNSCKPPFCINFTTY